MDRSELASFLRVRREALRPADVGLVPGPRRRTPGLRREEVALLASMSTDYYERLEQARGPHPSEPLVACLARALRLSTDERDHLYVLAGYPPPVAHGPSGYVDPGLMHVLDALTTVPAIVCDDLTTVLAQNPLGAALFGPSVGTAGREDNTVWRWFTDPASRDVYLPAEHEKLGRGYVADLRAAVVRRGKDPVSAALVADLLEVSAEFAAVWELHEVRPLRSSRKTYVHPAVGVLEMQCDVITSPDTGLRLVSLRPQPGTGCAERLDLLRVLGTQAFA
ncbi:helix-turn-helix transcriptional regulator [Umezawaea endophytica]|uniref:Helix-turn-helix transcriptional regulator n=1 Tax=Umezawaea endophytica TaxID=1654476 RepID=A0A9X2VIW1_9PSEU|nr:helix-turn-helix transcriptional regulator [Umezawaea endophytica]MCS7477312.1 helix-turn-helix transcriptional regulator [Umezawaea endophytica]